MISFNLRKLRCPRNYVHVNLILAFTLRTFFIMLVDSLIDGSHDDDEDNMNSTVYETFPKPNGPHRIYVGH